ncbi:PP0621 family protein [Ferrovum myxofaciens]|uniref:Uncharacterized protein n=2 Tax=Ferrovum myxofaciens TaxID=416213 RepID=A0A9E6MWD1_9PROT|nr:PP0621 family protein [Ferrovum myxofaciens]MBU6995823.1 hypothetical protein [Ferrovum myxofaciens]QKE39394.1 MAG: hypothetical protein HO273_12275 [Ferrovum myxofaciens]QWY74668.1 MAG: hypothetical protein JVY19_12850 [Ferrovum myxofaciens]QWY77414.1 MAG: hypothetical protein JZL65_13285 [Ferrovum myxofaciens]
MEKVSSSSSGGVTTQRKERQMLLKWILWGLVIFWVYRQITGRKAPTGSLFSNFTGTGRVQRPPSEASEELETTQDMVRCAHCGLFLPRQEALSQRGDWFCSEGHRQAGVRAQ